MEGRGGRAAGSGGAVEVIVGPHVVRVIEAPELDALLAEDGVVGRSDTQRLTIQLRSDLPRSVRDETLLHELLHHVIALTPFAVRWSDEEEEEIVRALSPLLSMSVRVIEA